MPQTTHGDAASMLRSPAPSLSRDTLRHLGGLLNGACVLDGAGRFAALLSKLDAAMMHALGDDATFRADLLRLMPNLRRYAVYLTHDETAAEDVVQDALMRAWRGRGGFTPGTNIEAWLFTITRNAFFSTATTGGREVNDTDGERAARLSVIPEQSGCVDVADMRAAIAGLPAFMREALMLIAVEDMSYEDAARIMGCRIGTVKSRVWRARERLVKALGYDGSEVGGDGLMLAASSSGTRKSLSSH